MGQRAQCSEHPIVQPKGVILRSLLSAREELWEVVGMWVGSWPRCSDPGLVWY